MNIKSNQNQSTSQNTLHRQKQNKTKKKKGTAEQEETGPSQSSAATSRCTNKISGCLHPRYLPALWIRSCIFPDMTVDWNLQFRSVREDLSVLAELVTILLILEVMIDKESLRVFFVLTSLERQAVGCWYSLSGQTTIMRLLSRKSVLLLINLRNGLGNHYFLESWPRGYKTFSILNSTEYEIFPAHKC